MCIKREMRVVIVVVSILVGFDVYSEEPVEGGWEMKGKVTVVCRSGEVERRTVWSRGVLCNLVSSVNEYER